MYHHPGKKMLCLVHGDDFVCVAKTRDLKRLKDQLSQRFEIKTKTMGLGE